MAATDGAWSRPELVTDPVWLRDHLDDPTIRIVDCGSAEPHATTSYERAHIPGAVDLSAVVHPWLKGSQIDSLNSHGRGTQVSGALPWPMYTTSDTDDWLRVIGPEALRTAMSKLGVSNDTTVVAYDDEGGPYAARLWWVLHLYGHLNVKLLDGGWQGWVASHQPISYGHEPPPPPGSFEPKPQHALQCDLEEIHDRLEDPDLRLVDARDDAEWSGAEDLGLGRAGHIPGAIHLEWTRFLNSQLQLRPPSELRDLVQHAAITEDRDVITYCFAGVRAAHVAFVLTLLGRDRVRVFDGSMFEWASRNDTPLDPVKPSG